MSSSSPLQSPTRLPLSLDYSTGLDQASIRARLGFVQALTGLDNSGEVDEPTLMAHFSLESELLPDDCAPLPAPGSEAQQRMIAQEEVVGSTYEEYNQRLDSVSEAKVGPMLDGCADVACELLHLARGECRNLKALDLGCGVGATTLRLLERVTGIEEVTLHDLSPVLLERVAGYVHQRFPRVVTRPVRFDLVTDNLEQHLQPQSFDLVVSTNCFQHFRRDRQAALIKQIHGVLRPGGVFMLLTHLKIVSRDWKPEIVRQILQHMNVSFGEHSPEKIREIVSSHVMNEHEHLTVPFVFDALSSAGYRFYECTHREFIYGVFAALK